MHGGKSIIFVYSLRGGGNFLITICMLIFVQVFLDPFLGSFGSPNNYELAFVAKPLELAELFHQGPQARGVCHFTACFK